MNAVKGESSEVMSASQIQNIKLQLDQITPMLCSIFESSLLHEPNSVTDVDVIDVLDQVANTFKAVLSTLSTIGSKEEWLENSSRTNIQSIQKSKSLKQASKNVPLRVKISLKNNSF